MRVFERMTTLEPTSVPAPILTLGPIILHGPTLTPVSSSAVGSILALASIDIHLPLGAQDRHRSYQFITN